MGGSIGKFGSTLRIYEWGEWLRRCSRLRHDCIGVMMMDKKHPQMR